MKNETKEQTGRQEVCIWLGTMSCFGSILTKWTQFSRNDPRSLKKENFSELYQVQAEVINSERNDIMQQHDKIINMAAKKVLAPQGLFRQGTSRTWLLSIRTLPLYKP